MSISENHYYYFNRKAVDFRGSVINTPAYYNLQSVKSGNPVSGWQEKISNHTDASSDYSATRYNVTVGRYTGSYRCSVGVESCDDTYYTNVPVAGAPAVTDSKVVNTALGNFLSNAHDVVSPFKGLTWLGELKETIQMLRHPASALRDNMSKYLRAQQRHRRLLSRKKSLKSLNQAISGTWLEYVYGWRPLIADIESACNAYSQHEADVQYLRAYGKAEGAQSDSNRVWVNHFANYGSYIVEETKRQRQKCVYKGVVRLKPEIQASSARNVIRLSGFGIEEFVPTAWELIPYSFVVDYFSNIGTILNSITPLFYDWVWWSCAITRTSKVTYQTKAGVKSPFTWAWSESHVPGTSECVAYSRSKPVLSLPVPQVELPGSGWQWANLLALASANLLKP